jgi:hypothetical protein
MGTISCISGIENDSRRSRYDKPSPEGFVPVPWGPGGKVLRGDNRYRYFLRKADRLPPVELIHGGYACAVDEITVTEHGYGALNPLFCETLQRGKIQMVIVIVGHENCINERQVFKTDAGDPVTLRAGP